MALSPISQCDQPIAFCLRKKCVRFAWTGSLLLRGAPVSARMVPCHSSFARSCSICSVWRRRLPRSLNPTLCCWTASCAATIMMRLPHWSPGTVRWCCDSVAGCWGMITRPRMRFRRVSWCWRDGQGRFVIRTPWRPGSTPSPCASRCGCGPRRAGSPPDSLASPSSWPTRTAMRWTRCQLATCSWPWMRKSAGCPKDIGCRCCCAASKGAARRKRLVSSTGPPARSRAGWSAAESGCTTGWCAAV